MPTYKYLDRYLLLCKDILVVMKQIMKMLKREGKQKVTDYTMAQQNLGHRCSI